LLTRTFVDVDVLDDALVTELLGDLDKDDRVVALEQVVVKDNVAADALPEAALVDGRNEALDDLEREALAPHERVRDTDVDRVAQVRAVEEEERPHVQHKKARGLLCLEQPQQVLCRDLGRDGGRSGGAGGTTAPAARARLCTLQR